MTSPVRHHVRVRLALLSLIAILAACGPATATNSPTASIPTTANVASVPTAGSTTTPAMSAAPVITQTEATPSTTASITPSVASLASTSATVASATSAVASAENFDLNNWDSVLAAAKGKTVNWYMYGGADSINRFVDTFYGKVLKDRYGVTLNRVPVADTVDAVNQVLSEKQAGKNPGAVDVIWINGANFASLRQANMLYDDWNQKLPNSKLVNYDNKALNLDFGTPIGALESPWSSAELQFIYDSARMKAGDLPRSYAALKDYACSHKGRVTYIAPGPGAFQGTRFVKQVLYEISGGSEQWSGTFNQALWDQWSPKLWQFLNDLKPCLWRQGATYAKDENELHSLFANNEIDFSSTQAIAGAGPLIKDGKVPPSARAFVFDKNMIGDFNYVAIPSNAPNKAAALVLANVILDPDLQAAQILPDNGFGLGYGIDVTKVTDPQQTKALQEAATALGPSATDANQLAKVLVSDMPQEYQHLVEQEWQKQVLQAK